MKHEFKEFFNRCTGETFRLSYQRWHEIRKGFEDAPETEKDFTVLRTKISCQFCKIRDLCGGGFCEACPFTSMSDKGLSICTSLYQELVKSYSTKDEKLELCDKIIDGIRQVESAWREFKGDNQ
jgi:hypothetical protein